PQAHHWPDPGGRRGHQRPRRRLSPFSLSRFGDPMSTVNHQILLDSRPQGEATAANFKLVDSPVPAPGSLLDGQVLVRHHYLSLDPYMRGRMNDSKSYAEPQEIGRAS